MRTIVVTGATGGIGLEAAVQIAEREPDARLVLIGRDAGRLAAARDRVGSRAEGLQAEFGSQTSVRRLAEQLLDTCDRIDVLVNNAGTVFAKRTLTEDGIEATFAVNHLAPFLLTNLMLDRIVRSAPARIVNVSSVAHLSATMDFDDLGFERGYKVMAAYQRSKLANVMFTRSLARRLDGTGVTVNAVHPGGVATGIWSHAPWYARPVLALAKRFAMISPQEGAAHLTKLVIDPDLEHTTGQYFDQADPRNPSRLARDDAVAERLWTESARLTGIGD